MGQYENQLRSIGQATDWSIPELTRLIAGFEDLIAAMGKLAGAVGWTGESADLAIHKFTVMRAAYAKRVDALVDIRRQISDANRATSSARVNEIISRLPSAHMPTDEHALKLLVGAFFPPIPIVGLVLAEQDVQRVEAQLRAKREVAAYHELLGIRKEIGVIQTSVGGVVDDLPPYVDDDDSWKSSGGGPSGIGTGSWSGSGYGYGNGGGNDDGNGDDGNNDGGNDDTGDGGDNNGDDTTDTYVDSHLDPSLGGPRTGGLGGGSFGGGGLGSGLAGVGIAGGAGAALAGASRLANGGAGALGAAAAGKAGASNAMMGAPGGGAGSSSKNKRSGLGLVAPKLEDDEVVGPKSAGARAGGRDSAGTDK